MIIYRRSIRGCSVRSHFYAFVAITLGAMVLLAGLASAQAATTTNLVTINTRPSVTQKFILIKPDQPVGAVILFAGNNGYLNLQESGGNIVINNLSGNFLVRTRQEYVSRGFMVAVVDAPSDHANSTGMDSTFRTSAEHATDIEAVIDYLKAQANVSVWLNGTSAGSISVISIGRRSPQKATGLISSATITGLINLNNLGAISVPTFLLHHAQDQCASTTPAGAQAMHDALTGVSIKQLTYLTGGLPPISDPCQAQSEHGFYGIETEAVNAIVAFIRAHSPMPVPTVPTAMACNAAGGTVVSADWNLARPLGIAVGGGNASLLLQLAAFTAAVDVYLVIDTPFGQQFSMNASGQLLPFPGAITPLRANSAAALAHVGPPFVSVPLTGIPPGGYSFFLVVVPAGTNTATFNLASSPYYLWCATQVF